MQIRKILRVVCVITFFFSLAGFLISYLNLPTTLLVLFLSSALWSFEYFLFERNIIPQVSNFDLDLEVVRKLANTEKRQLPTHLNSLIVAEGEIPDWIVVAGGGSHNFGISFTSFQVVYDDKTIIIECPFNKALYDKFCRFKLLGIKGKAFYERNYNIMQKALLEADSILVTHEHWDHTGGIAQSPHINELMKKTVLTSEQKSGHTIGMANFPKNALDNYVPLEYDHYHTLAPGIVLIKAPGHSCGSQMIFIQLQNGEEFLFIGDIAWNLINIEDLKNHSRIGMLLRYENGRYLGHQLRWLFDNIWNNPKESINLITSHDREQLEYYHRVGLIGDQFV
jgi:glyoxylase-like metal-dependent hydrolase (beta-lactamase superfamily II)